MFNRAAAFMLSRARTFFVAGYTYNGESGVTVERAISLAGGVPGDLAVIHYPQSQNDQGISGGDGGWTSVQQSSGSNGFAFTKWKRVTAGDISAAQAGTLKVVWTNSTLAYTQVFVAIYRGRGPLTPTFKLTGSLSGDDPHTYSGFTPDANHAGVLAILNQWDSGGAAIPAAATETAAGLSSRLSATMPVASGIPQRSQLLDRLEGYAGGGMSFDKASGYNGRLTIIELTVP